MIVKELIKALEKEDQELMVVVSGYEGGETEVESVEVVPVKLNVNSAWYYGEHEQPSPFGVEQSGCVNVLKIEGKRH